MAHCGVESVSSARLWLIVWSRRSNFRNCFVPSTPNVFCFFLFFFFVFFGFSDDFPCFVFDFL
jgi:hypothetical protein